LEAPKKVLTSFLWVNRTPYRGITSYTVYPTWKIVQFYCRKELEQIFGSRSFNFGHCSCNI